jgi:hypothetical protein
MSHHRSDVIRMLRNYHMFLHHVGLFPDLFYLDRNTGRRLFRGYEFIARLPDVEVYVLATKCIVFSRWCSNFFWAVDNDLSSEIIAKAKVLKPTVENQVNTWIATFNTSTIPYRWLDDEGVANWHVLGQNGLTWNFAA